MRYLAYIIEDTIVDQVPSDLSDDAAIALDTMLRNNGLLNDSEELAVAEDVDELPTS